jgi:hypothetical protein
MLAKLHSFAYSTRMAGITKKKSRSSNFSFTDQQRLVNLVKKHENVVECKKTDKFTFKQKVSQNNFFKDKTANLNAFRVYLGKKLPM